MTKKTYMLAISMRSFPWGRSDRTLPIQADDDNQAIEKTGKYMETMERLGTFAGKVVTYYLLDKEKRKIYESKWPHE